MTRRLLVCLLVIISGLATAGGPPTETSWQVSLQKKIPPFGTLAATGKFEMLCQCMETSPPAIENAAGAIETLGPFTPTCVVLLFNPDGSLNHGEGCSKYLPLPNP